MYFPHWNVRLETKTINYFTKVKLQCTSHTVKAYGSLSFCDLSEINSHSELPPQVLITPLDIDRINSHLSLSSENACTN